MKPFARGLPIALIALLAIGFLAPVLFTDRALLPGEFLQRLQPFSNMPPPGSPSNWNALQWDALAQYYPWRLFARRSLQHNEIPLWNPHEFCGAPFVANGQSAVYYPLNLLFWLLPTAVAFGWSAALHLFLAGVFMFGLARTLKLSVTASLLSAVSFMFCGFLITWLELPTLVNVAVWIPLVFLLIEKILQKPGAGSVALLAMVIGVQFLAGHFQVSLYLLLAVALRWLWELGKGILRRVLPHNATAIPGEVETPGNWTSLTAVALAVLLGCCLASGQILPTAEFAGHNHRSSAPTPEGYAWYLANAMPWEHLATFLFPDLFGNPTRNLYWSHWFFRGGAGSYTEMCGYVGLLPLVLGLLSFGYLRRVQAGFYGFLMVLSLLIALGTPITYPLFFFVPGFSQVGGFSRSLILFCFSMALLAGIGWDLFLQSDKAPTKRSLLAIAVLVSLGLVLAGGIFFQVRGRSFLFYDLRPTHPPLSFAAALIGLWLALAVIRLSGKISREVFHSLSLAVVVCDLLAFAVGFNPTAPRASIYPEFQWTRAGKPRERSLSVTDSWSLYSFPDATLPPNGMMVYRAYDVQGYDSLQSREYKALAARLEGGNPTPPENGNMLLLHNFHSPWINILGVRYVLASHPLPTTRMPLLSDHPLYLYENRNAYPAAFTTDHLPSIDEAERGFGFEPATVAEYSPLAVGLRPNSRGRYLILTDSYLPGWHVFVDGRETAPICWVGAFRAVELPDREARRVEWVYLPTSCRLGNFLAVLSLALIVSLLSTGGLRARGQRKPIELRADVGVQ